jgi:hypothetical protein
MPRTDRGARASNLADAVPPVDALVPRELTNRLWAEIRRRPARSLGIALGAGYLAGGGIGTILTARLLGAGARIAMRLAFVPVLADGVERALFTGREPDGSNAHKHASKHGSQREMNS